MLIDILVIVIVALAAYWIVTKFFPEPAQMIALLIVGLICLLWLLGAVGLVDSNSLLLK